MRNGANLGPEDLRRLERFGRTTVRFEAGTDILSQEEEPHYVHVVNAGTACRYKMLPDGRRAILALLLPGDFCDLHVAILGEMDHSIGALTDCRIGRVSEPELNEMLERYPRINRACWWATLVDEAILREWLVNVGRRPSERQLAHLFCELYLRLEVVGLARDGGYRMPYTQITLGDLLGITAVHVQRVMAVLRETGLIALQGRELTIPDFGALAELAEFDPAYLHLRNARARRDAGGPAKA